MASGRAPPPPLVILCLLLISGSSSLPTASRVTGTDPSGPPRPRWLSLEGLALPTEDYDQLETTAPPLIANTVPPDGENPRRCDYNPCLEGQPSCAALRASSGCLCPGSTLHNVPPEPPRLKSVTWNGSEVVLQWCAPYSYVTSYLVTVGGKERKRFGAERRSGGLGEVKDIAKVCLAAANESGASDSSCMMFHPRDNSLPLKAGLIGGALGLLLLLVLGVLLWRHRRQRKRGVSISMHDAAVAE